MSEYSTLVDYDTDDDPGYESWAAAYAERQGLEPEDEQVADEEPEPFDPAAVASTYLAADRRERMEIWTGLDEDGQQALARIGIGGPIEAAPDDDFEVVYPDEEGYARLMSMAAQNVNAGLAAIRAGDLDATEDLASELESLVATADLYPENHPERAGALQRAAYLIEATRNAAVNAIPFNEGQIKKARTYYGVDGKWRTTEYDLAGKQRTTIHEDSPEEARVKTRGDERPWKGHDLGEVLEAYGTWDHATRRRFISEEPEMFKLLQQQASFRAPQRP